MEITYDEQKRNDTLLRRGLDFAHANAVFAGAYLTVLDDREDYGEDRYQTLGLLNETVVMVVWTPRDNTRRVFSMRRCNDEERKLYYDYLDRPG